LLTYRISKSKAPRRVGQAVKTFNYEDKEKLLHSNLNKTFFRVGDIVRFKKPRRNPLVGTVIEIQSKVSEVTWVNGGTSPMNIILEVVKGSNGATPKTERVKTNVKKLLFVEAAK
jgi:hypothetical protein